MSDLLEHIEWSSVEALNAQPDKGLANALKQGYREQEDLVLESDTDEQILIHIPFNQQVKLSGIVIKSVAKPNQAPKTVKLFVNQPTIGFDEASNSAGVQQFELTADDLQGAQPLPLPLVKFSRVNTLTIFIESNQEDEDTTVIEKISLHGGAGDAMNVAAIKDVSKEEGH